MFFRVNYQWVTSKSVIRNTTILVEAKDKNDAEQKAKLIIEKNLGPNKWSKISSTHEA